jgi:ribosomal protein S25
MTRTQEAILLVLAEASLVQWLTPRQISERAGIDNWGGTARSLRALMEQGKVKQAVLETHRRWNLYGYRLVRDEEAARPLLAGAA